MIRTTTRHLGALALPALLLVAPSPVRAQEAAIKIAVVDIQTVVAESEAGKKLQQDLADFGRAAQAELTAKADDLKRLREQAAATSDLAEQRTLAKNADQRAIDLSRLKDDKEREGQKMQQDGLQGIERALGPIFSEARTELGLDLILARTPGITLMVSDRLDITQLIVDRFNAASQE